MNTLIFKIIKIEEYGIVFDDSIKVLGDWYYIPFTDSIEQMQDIDYGEFNPNKMNWKKIIFSIGKRLEGVTLIELADDIEKLAQEYSILEYPSNMYSVEVGMPHRGTAFRGYIAGYKANTNKYNEEDILKTWIAGKNHPNHKEPQAEYDKFLKYLKKPVIPTEVELEVEELARAIGKKVDGDGFDKEHISYLIKITNKETNTIIAVNYKI